MTKLASPALSLSALVLLLGLAGCAGATPEAADSAGAGGTLPAAEVGVPTAAEGPTLAAPESALSVSDVWARTSPMEAANGAAYMVISNAGASDDKLVGAQADVSSTVELHETKEVDGMMSMAPVASVAVPAGGQAELKPGGYHVMFIGLKRPLKAGDTFPLTLIFEQAGEVQVQAEVRSE